MFLYRKSKKELDITDALKKKEACITIGGKSVVVRAFKLSKALELLSALGNLGELVKLAGQDIGGFNRVLLAKLPLILDFCLPEYKIDAEKVTLAEFADLTLAVWCVNDMERIISNFTKAVASMPKLMQGLAPSPKQ
jgi:hypothetical protein